MYQVVGQAQTQLSLFLVSSAVNALHMSRKAQLISSGLDMV